MLVNLIVIAVLPYISIGIHLLYTLEVDPADFTCNYQKQIKGDPRTVFELSTSTQSLEKVFMLLSFL